MRYIILLALMFTGCATPPTVSNAPTDSMVAQTIAPQGSTIAIGLQDAAFNLDSAVSIGVLQADDQAVACVHSALRLAGLEAIPGTTPARSFTPKVSDLISGASVLYIQQVQSRNQAPFTMSVGCKAVIGDLVIQGLGAGLAVANQSIPGKVLGVITGH